jgi:hypothetical protein
MRRIEENSVKSHAVWHSLRTSVVGMVRGGQNYPVEEVAMACWQP